MMNSGYLHKIRDSAQIEDSGRIGNNTTFLQPSISFRIFLSLYLLHIYFENMQ